MIKNWLNFIYCLFFCVGILSYSLPAQGTMLPYPTNQETTQISKKNHASITSNESILPENQRIEWNPDIPERIPPIKIVAVVTDYGAIPDDGLDDSEAFQNAINEAGDSGGGAVLIPAGTFLFKQFLLLDKNSVVLHGAGSKQTYLIFDYEEDKESIIVRGNSLDESPINLAKGYNKGSTSIDVGIENISRFKLGGFAQIQQENNPDLMDTINPASPAYCPSIAERHSKTSWLANSWSENAVGEIVRIKSISNSNIILESGLHYDYEITLNPVIVPFHPVEYCGIENLHITRKKPSLPACKFDKKSFSIHFDGTAYSWVRNVESELALRSHVTIRKSYGCTVRDSSFIDAHCHEGGFAYGVEFIQHSTNCLVENNIFRRLRHSMLVHIGANGNVFGYNYSTETYQPNSGWTTPDISVHGHYPAYNLFEGNVIQEAVCSDFWGPAGPGNTFLRNCAERETITIRDVSNFQNLIGNKLPQEPKVLDQDCITLETLFIRGNYPGDGIGGPPLTEIPKSFYLTKKPSFYGDSIWPSISPIAFEGCNNPARDRFQSGCFIPPKSDAGSDQEVAEGSGVNLDGSNSLAAQIQSFYWRQLTGPSVILTNPNTTNPSFTAPEVDQKTTMVFELTITDDCGIQARDEVAIVATNIQPTEPVVLISTDKTSYIVGETVSVSVWAISNDVSLQADVYIKVILPGGQIRYYRNWGTMPKPAVHSWPVTDWGPKELFDYTFKGNEPNGEYTLEIYLTEPETSNIIGQINSVTFTLSQ